MLAELFSAGPARILGVGGGVIEAGAPADITIADLTKRYTFTEESMVSRGKNSPFIGKKLKGKITHTIVGGKLVYEG